MVRNQLGLNQAEMAEGCHRSRSAYNIIENGAVSPSLDFIVDLHAFFIKKGVSISYDYLLCATDHMNEKEMSKKLQDELDVIKKDYAHLKEVTALQRELISSKK